MKQSAKILSIVILTLAFVLFGEINVVKADPSDKWVKMPTVKDAKNHCSHCSEHEDAELIFLTGELCDHQASVCLESRRFPIEDGRISTYKDYYEGSDDIRTDHDIINPHYFDDGISDNTRIVRKRGWYYLENISSGKNHYKLCEEVPLINPSPSPATKSNTSKSTHTYTSTSAFAYTYSYVDFDTYKSCLPSGTITSKAKDDLNKSYEYKAHDMNSQDVLNQNFLANTFASQNGKSTQIIATYGIYPNRDLSASENASKQLLTWNNLPINTPTTIYAICYNQTDGAYTLKGTVNATQITLFLLK